jgi:predicted nuclease of predicted toxin-antitoxin system
MDINPKMKDEEIWNYAIENDLVILTKDTYFYNRFITSNNSPRIIFFKIGNMTLDELHIFFKSYWNSIVSKLDHNRFIIVSKDSIQLIY